MVGVVCCSVIRVLCCGEGGRERPLVFVFNAPVNFYKLYVLYIYVWVCVCDDRRTKGRSCCHDALRRCRWSTRRLPMHAQRSASLLSFQKPPAEAAIKLVPTAKSALYGRLTLICACVCVLVGVVGLVVGFMWPGDSNFMVAHHQLEVLTLRRSWPLSYGARLVTVKRHNRVCHATSGVGDFPRAMPITGTYHNKGHR